ncbi:putative non-specific serine/threonine protein kinase [Helianthus debilis subsp. tardiflorus]
MVPGMPTRFTYEELKTATENFTKKLGQGGFGSVFKGTLEDESKIAVCHTPISTCFTGGPGGGLP